jgi:hypothetical protein
MTDPGDSSAAPTGPFQGRVRWWRPEQASGLTVIDLPADVTAALGGLRQMKVRGTINGAPYESNTMPAGGGVLALSVSRAILKSAGLAVGDEATLTIERR